MAPVEGRELSAMGSSAAFDASAEAARDRASPIDSSSRARSSVGERSLHTREVAGSKPAAPILEARGKIAVAGRHADDPDRELKVNGALASCTMCSMSKIAIITGANQGLGFALAEGLAQQLAPEDIVYLTGRDPDRVRAATARIAHQRAHVRGEVLD